MVIGKADQVEGCDLWPELVLQDLRIGQAKSERNNRSNISEDRGPHLGIELREVLMGKNQTDSVFRNSESILARLSVVKFWNSSR